MHLENYSWSGRDDYPIRFQYTCFNLFPSWLEYLTLKDNAYCYLCSENQACTLVLLYELNLVVTLSYKILEAYNNVTNLI